MIQFYNTVKPVCNDHLYDKIYFITCDLFSNVFRWRLKIPIYSC